VILPYCAPMVLQYSALKPLIVGSTGGNILTI
jgi:hypothetical protein